MIRVATINDIETLVRLGQMLHEASELKRHTYKPMKVADLLYSVISGLGVVFVAEKDGEVIGAFAGGLTELWYSDTVVAFDYCIFIKPDKRHGRTAIRLLIAFETWAREMGAKEIHMGITTGINVDSTSRLYQSQGFTLVGPLFRKEV